MNAKGAGMDKGRQDDFDLQAEWEALIARGGGTLYVPAGEHRVTQLRWPSHVPMRLVGVGVKRG